MVIHGWSQKGSLPLQFYRLRRKRCASALQGALVFRKLALGFGGASWGGGSRSGLRKCPCLLPSPRYPESSAQTARGEEGTGGGLGPLRKAVLVSGLLAALREARGGAQADLGAGHMWPCGSYWVSNGPPGPRLSHATGRPEARVPPVCVLTGASPRNLPRPRLPCFKRSWGSHTHRFF
ncbi:unnamed protein product [Rangifer tarandus platyrhynchus]|uniref:Uncharacterized protein n=1 Tax=Rangifer tarandus platyrhynchus TaxID=3082113 RepID=A0ABN8ZVJ8_RANTA|nr:unnamed protein product [Rangifer tarandus platyrhynchus]